MVPPRPYITGEWWFALLPGVADLCNSYCPMVGQGSPGNPSGIGVAVVLFPDMYTSAFRQKGERVYWHVSCEAACTAELELCKCHSVEYKVRG